MFATRSILRRSTRLRPPRPSSLLLLRPQHNHNGPHKEYFQNPSQYPSNLNPSSLPPNTTNPSQFNVPQDSLATQYDLSRQQSSRQHGDQNQQQHQYQHQHQQQEQATPTPWLLRFTRQVSFILICFSLGLTAGAAVVSWDYSQPPFDPSSEEYAELLEGINDLLETAPICDRLREHGWIEEPNLNIHSSLAATQSPISPARPTTGRDTTSDRHLINDTLAGVQGFSYKIFRHPTSHITAMVLFPGFGLEGWPDVLHGGSIATAMIEGFDIHMAPVLAQEGLSHMLRDPGPGGLLGGNAFTFKRKARPGEIHLCLFYGGKWGHGTVADHADAKGDELEYVIVHLGQAAFISADDVPQFVRLDEPNPMFPQITPDVTLVIPSDDSTIHATAEFTMFTKSERLVRKDGETDAELRERYSQESDRLANRNDQRSPAQAAQWKK